MLQARRPCQSFSLRPVSRTAGGASPQGGRKPLPLASGLGLRIALAAVVTLGFAGCKLFTKATTEDKYPKMSPEARAVKIYYSGEQPECLEVLRLGRVQAKAGDFPDPDPQFISPQVHMDVALAWLRVEAANKGANGVILLEQKGNHDGTLHIAIGEAIFCRVAN